MLDSDFSAFLLVTIFNKMFIEANNADRERYRGEGREFLQANAQKQGVVTLESGLQYKVIEEGSDRQPVVSDFVLVDYRGTRLDGAEFDSSYRNGEPLKVQVAKVIPGWTEALQLMKEGAEWQLFIPADLAFGERGPLADQTVLYDIKLIKVSPD